MGLLVQVIEKYVVNCGPDLFINSAPGGLK